MAGGPTVHPLVGHHQGQVDVVQLEAQRGGGSAVQTGKTAQALSAHGQQIDRYLSAVVQAQFGPTLLQRQAARHLHKAEHIQRNVTAGAQRFALGAVHGQCLRGRTAADLNGRQHGVEHRVLRIFGLVDGQGDVFSGDRQTVHAVEVGRGSAGLQRGPAALGVFFVAHQGKRKVNAAQAQALRVVGARADAGEGAGVGGAERDDSGLHERAVSQGHFLVGTLKGELALRGEEAKQVDGQLTAGAQQAALGAVHVERLAAAGAGEHAQAGLASAVVHHRVIGVFGRVQSHAEGAAAEGNAVHAAQGGAVGAGLQAGPAAAAVALRAHQRQAKRNAAELQAQAAGHAHLGAQVLATQREQVHQQAVGGFVGCGACRVGSQLHRGGARQQGKVTADAEEVADHHLGAAQRHGLAARFQFAEGVGYARHHDRAARGVRCRAVPLHAHRSGRQLHRIAQRQVGSAAGLQHDAAVVRIVADDQRHAGVAHAGAHVARAHRGTGRAGQHLQFARSGIALKSKVAGQRQRVAQAGLQARDPQHGIGQGAHGRHRVGVRAHLQHLLGLRRAGGVQAKHGAVSADGGKPAADQIQATADFQQVAVVVVEHQAEAAAVDTGVHAARAEAGVNALACHQQALCRRGKAHGAGERHQAAQNQLDVARQGGAFVGIAAVKRVAGTTHADGAGVTRQIEHAVVGRSAAAAQSQRKVE